jgi:hypothetical protein
MGRSGGRGEEDEARRRFEQDLEAREEVVPAGTDPLPPGATHEAGDDDEDGGRPRRRRFKAT